jgi:hypothetical protein
MLWYCRRGVDRIATYSQANSISDNTDKPGDLQIAERMIESFRIAE